MNRKTITALAGIALLTFAAASCSKKKPTSNNNGNNNNQSGLLVNVFNNLKTQEQTFTVPSGAYTTIEGANGTVIEFNPESFLDKDENIIGPGLNLTVKLTEALDYKDMIRNRVQTATQSNQRLISGGAIKLAVSYEGLDTVIANYYSISYPTTNTPPSDFMSVYYGYEDSSTDVGGNTVMWFDDTTGTTKWNRRDPNSTGSTVFFTFDSVTNFGWINCDYFYNAPDPKTDVGVTFPDNTYNNENTEVYIVFPSINSVTGMYNYMAASNSFSFGYTGYHIPVGSQIHVLTVSTKNEEYYMYIQKNITVTNNHTITVTPTLTTESQMLSEIENL